MHTLSTQNDSPYGRNVLLQRSSFRDAQRPPTWPIRPTAPVGIRDEPSNSHYESNRSGERVAGRVLAPGYAPLRTVLKLQEYWGISEDEMLVICGLPKEDGADLAAALARYMRATDVQARLQSLMVIRSRLSALFGGDRAVERRWLRTPWDRLDGTSALDQMLSSDRGQLSALECQVREMSGV